MTTRLELAVRLRLRSPFLFRDSAGAAFGVDAAALRDAWGRPLIPADQLRGVLRHALEDVVAVAAPTVLTPADMDLLFGRGSADARTPGGSAAANAFTPARGALLPTDLVAEGAPGEVGQSVRVAIEAASGAAKPGALMLAELCAPVGTELDFTGSLTVFAPDGSEARLIAALQRAAALIAAIGAQKSIGFGEVVSAEITERARRSLALPTVAAAPPCRAALRMVFDRPFLVDAVREADNLFVGSEVVPGGAVKGALARRLELAGTDPENGPFAELLARTVISHAFPENRAGMPAGHPLPLSLIAEEAGGTLLVGDALGLPAGRGALFRSGGIRMPARYAPDWKDGWADIVAARIGRSAHESPSRDLRVHTAISRDTGAAADGRLFALAARAHRYTDPATGAPTGTPRGWRLTLDPPEDVDPQLWAQLLSLLEGGLDGIGRTGASAAFELPSDTEALPLVPRMRRGSDQVAVMLLTPAVMTDADPTLTAVAAYAAYWHGTLGAKLVDHVAMQSLAGGYVAQRHRSYGGHRYVPFVLTAPGSVFLLRDVDLPRLERLARRGLPVAELDGTRPGWRTCPFVPENGYGAFTADWLADDLRLDEVEHV